MAIVKKRVRFSAAHRLWSDKLSEEENLRIYGKCASPNYHGHNYVVDVAVEGPIDADTGMVINFTALKGVLEDEIISKLDHSNLNMDVEMLKGVIPTAENLARKIWQLLENKLGNAKIHSVELWENEDSSAIYNGKD